MMTIKKNKKEEHLLSDGGRRSFHARPTGPLSHKNVLVHLDALPYVFENVLNLGTDYDVRISARQQFHVPPGMQKTKQKPIQYISPEMSSQISLLMKSKIPIQHLDT